MTVAGTAQDSHLIPFSCTGETPIHHHFGCKDTHYFINMQYFLRKIKQLGTVLSCLTRCAISGISQTKKNRPRLFGRTFPECLITYNRTGSSCDYPSDAPRSGSNTWCHASRGLTRRSPASYHPRYPKGFPPCGSSAQGHNT